MSEGREGLFLVGVKGSAPHLRGSASKVDYSRTPMVTAGRRAPNRSLANSRPLFTERTTSWELPLIDVPILTLLLNSLADSPAGSPWMFRRPRDPYLLSGHIATMDGLFLDLDGGIIQEIGFVVNTQMVAKASTKIEWQKVTEADEASAAISAPGIKLASCLNCRVLISGTEIDSDGFKFTLRREMKAAGYQSDGNAVSVGGKNVVNLIATIDAWDHAGTEELLTQREAVVTFVISNGVNTLTFEADSLLRSSGRTIVHDEDNKTVIEVLAKGGFSASLS